MSGANKPRWNDLNSFDRRYDNCFIFPKTAIAICSSLTHRGFTHADVFCRGGFSLADFCRQIAHLLHTFADKNARTFADVCRGKAQNVSRHCIKIGVSCHAVTVILIQCNRDSEFFVFRWYTRDCDTLVIHHGHPGGELGATLNSPMTVKNHIAQSFTEKVAFWTTTVA